MILRDDDLAAVRVVRSRDGVVEETNRSNDLGVVLAIEESDITVLRTDVSRGVERQLTELGGENSVLHLDRDGGRAHALVETVSRGLSWTADGEIRFTKVAGLLQNASLFNKRVSAVIKLPPRKALPWPIMTTVHKREEGFPNRTPGTEL